MSAFSPPPQFFPAALVRLDPLLEQAGGNRLYSLFRERRERSRSRVSAIDLAPRSLEWFGPLINGLWTFLRGILRVGIPIAFLLVFLFRGRFVLFFLFLAGWLLLGPRLNRQGRVVVSPLLRALGHRKNATMRMPFWLSDALNPVRYWEHACVDLWMTGVSGREVAEALYLEHRERTWWYPIVLSAWVPFAFGWILFTQNLLLTLPGAMFVCSAIYMTFEMVRYGLCSWKLVSARALVRRMNNWVDGSELFRNDYRIDSLRFPAETLLLPPLALGVPWFFLETVLAMKGFPDLRSATALLWLLPCAPCVLLGLVLRWYGKGRIPSGVSACQRLFRRAEWPFNHFLSFVVLSDPAGADWAWRYFRDLRRLPSTPWMDEPNAYARER